MPRYIDADCLIQEIEYWRDKIVDTYGKNDEYANCLAEVMMKIDDAPTADVVEVVRCKDCKYYNRLHHYCDGIGYWFGEEDAWSDNGFCYKGERREEDEM